MFFFDKTIITKYAVLFKPKKQNKALKKCQKYALNFYLFSAFCHELCKLKSTLKLLLRKGFGFLRFLCPNLSLSFTFILLLGYNLLSHKNKKAKEEKEMKLIIVRHGDPNYVIDSLTKRGKKEAKLLAKRLCKIDTDYYFCSPLGRAKKTASYTLKAVGKKAETLPWLTEFEGKVKQNGLAVQCWDRMPSAWTCDERYYTDKWHETEQMKELDVKTKYDRVCSGIDSLLKEHGYEHNGKIFNVKNSNHDSLVLFCHFGVECVILSHILGVSPMPLWHNFVALPTSVTTLITEEREEGTASFRIQQFGDISHLYKGGLEPSFAARFCECFDDDTRH